MEHRRLGRDGVGGSEEDEIFSRKSRFLDVESLYKSRDLKGDKGTKKCGRKVASKDNEGLREGRKRSKSNSSGSRVEGTGVKKNRKLSDGRRGVNGAVRAKSFDLNGEVVPSLSQSQNSVNSFLGVSLSLDHDSNFFRIPKRPRGSARRNRFESDLASKVPVSQAESLYKVAGSNDEVNKVEVHRVSMFPDSPVASTSGQSAGKLRSTSASNVTKQNGKRKPNSSVDKESENGIISARHYKEEHGAFDIHNGDMSSIKRQTNHRKRKVFPSESRTIVEKVENSVRESVSVHTNSPDDDDDEENLEQNAARMLSSRFDPSCTGFSAKMRSYVSLDTNRFPDNISSSQDFDDRDINSLAASEPPSVDDSSRVLRPKKQHGEKGFSRKRRHYYEIVPRGLDAHWVLNRKIKVFWPLDKSWYYGFVSDYDPEKKLHQIKYDDKDVEWVDLQGEKFKLLLFPDEVPGKAELKQSVGVAVADKEKMSSQNNIDSEPIISWLSRSSRQAKQYPFCPFKKQKLLRPVTLNSHDNYNDAKGNGHLLVEHGSDKSGDRTLCSNLCDDDSRDENSECSEVKELIVYYRKRYRKNGGNLYSVSETDHSSEIYRRTPMFHAKGSSGLHTLKDHHSRVLGCSDRSQLLWSIDDNGSLQISMELLKSVRYIFDICQSLLALHGKLFGREQIWLSNTLLLSQYGTVISISPIVAVEMLIVDNIIGMRSLLFEGRLENVSALVFLILSVFNPHGEDYLFVESQLPVTSVRIILSFVINPRKKQLFAFYNFSKLKTSKWLHLESQLNHRSLFAQELPLSECRYDNIKAFEGGNYQCDAPGTGFEQLDLQKITKQCMVPICRSRESCSSELGRAAFKLAVMPGQLPPFAVSYAAAPTFFHNLHLKMLMRRGFACISLGDNDSSEDTESDCIVDKQDFCESLSLSRKDIEINFASNAGSCLSGAASAGCSTAVLPHSGKDLMPASDVGVSTVSSHCLPNSKLDITGSSTLSEKIQKNATLEATVPEECELDDQCLQFVGTSQPSVMKTSITHGGFSSVSGISIEIPSSDQIDRSPDERTCLLRQPPNWNANMGYIKSPNYVAPRIVFQCNQSSTNSPLEDPSPVWPDEKTNVVYGVFSNRPKKPRSQVQYTTSYGGTDLSSKQKLHQRSLPCKKVRRADERRSSTGSKSSPRNLEFSACDANVLVTSGDKGWRDCGAKVVLEVPDQKECRLSIKMSGVTKYTCKVNNVLQWSTNRYTHAMMWKGGKDWALEFPDRSQWLLFKEIYEECHNRNIRAASVKHIPIPGVCLIEDIDGCANNMPFVRHATRYFKQVENDVEMAMNPLHVLYDMDSEDEVWLSENNRAVCSEIDNCGEISEELFEKTMDMFEKVAHAEKRDNFTVDEIDELGVGVGSTRVVKLMYEHWLQKRQRKGISLIRHLQPPLWAQYQQQVNEWEQTVASVCQERPAFKEKPPMFAFCLRPRGLENLNKGSKHRSHKKLSLSVHNHADLEGRRLNGVAFGEDRILFSRNDLDSSEASPLLHASTPCYSPHDASGIGCFSLGNDGSEWNHHPVSHRNKTKKIVGGFPSTPLSVASHNQRPIGKRNSIHHWTMDKYYQPEVGFRHGSLLGDGSDVQEFRFRDPSGAARHAQTVAKIKREKAQRLMYRADMAIHKAVVAIMTAEAMKVSTEDSDCDV
ncbi:zinc finger transcription factor [Lithospermum erythrorhizon]|uniref:Enhancer of polycomb-like protein n=1 Tax=Lithospermum erythrorhizon TaxID=34254 RepID=A0AAV3NG46_LITER